MSGLTLSQLAAFLKLAETSSFREAAAQLGVSQPALSRTIQHIEVRMGARLFDRDTRSVMLTPAGERFRPLVIRLTADYDAVFRQMLEFVEGREGLIRIAALPSVACAFLPAAISSFHARYPGVRFEILEDFSAPVHQLVRERAADIGIAPPPHSAGDLRYRELIKDSIVFVCRKDDPLSGFAQHDWTVFADRPFVSMSEETSLRRMVESGLEQSGVLVERRFNCKQPTTAARLVDAGQGISALTRLTMAQVESPTLAWLPLVNPVVGRSIGIVRHKARSFSPPAGLFVRELERQARIARSDQLSGLPTPASPPAD